MLESTHELLLRTNARERVHSLSVKHPHEAPGPLELCPLEHVNPRCILHYAYLVSIHNLSHVHVRKKPARQCVSSKEGSSCALDARRTYAQRSSSLGA